MISGQTQEIQTLCVNHANIYIICYLMQIMYNNYFSFKFCVHLKVLSAKSNALMGNFHIFFYTLTKQQEDDIFTKSFSANMNYLVKLGFHDTHSPT